LILGWWVHPTPNHLTTPLDLTVLVTSRVLHREFRPPYALLDDFCPNDSVFSLLNLTSMRRFQSPSPFEHFKGVILPKLSLVNSSFPKGSLLSLLAANPKKTSGYLSLRPYALFATLISQSSFWIYKIQGFNWPAHTLHGSVLHLHFSWYENNDISPDISEIKLRPSSTHTLRTFTSLLAGILRERNN
jgi:hypothetical protein